VARLRISYNAPVVLTFALLAVIVHLLPDDLKSWFVAYPKFAGARTYVGLVSHILGHGNWEHLIGNFMLILLIGPILEERYGSKTLLTMILATALITGLVNVTFMSHPLIGASGIAFMMIILASTANIRQGEIPLTFIAVSLIYLGGELYRSVNADDNISHSAHLIGGVVGGAFGFLLARAKGGAEPVDVKALGLPAAKPALVPKPAAKR
jgi:rhomboid protease GluP